MNAIDFYHAVKTGGIWDYKQYGFRSEYEDFGNYHYGVVGTAVGFSSDELLRAAGAYQIYSDLLQHGAKQSPGWPCSGGASTYGDQAADQRWIKEGIRDYNKTYSKGRGASGNWAPIGFSTSW